MDKDHFEKLLQSTVDSLNSEINSGSIPSTSKDFEYKVRKTLESLIRDSSVLIDFDPHPHVFPDIAVDTFGIEVKFTTKDTWRSVANSVFESTRNPNVLHIYIIFGKMGGIPEVKWGLYDDHIIHVRTTHVPRFEVEMSSKESLFSKIGVTYNDFSVLSVHEKMNYIRTYARSRLGEGERLWWLEDVVEQEHSLPMQVRLYMNLNNEEKKRLRGEAALLCPQIVKSSRTRNKYNDAALYLLTYRGVLCPQARDLFSAGSVAIPDNTERGGIYIQRALKNIESEMIYAATYLEEALFVEYWGFSVDPNQRINEWLRLADTYAQTWKPSDSLFTINSS